jgi:ribosomal protein L11 methyltransferase
MNDLAAETSVVAWLAIDAATARRLSDGLAQALDTGEAAVAAYETQGDDWTVEIHFSHPPDEVAVRDLIGELAGAAAREGVVFATVAARDWVAASLAGLPPVQAGRFFLHGSHDRSRVPGNRIGIEIEAALAFGTGHHGTTRACLIALDRLLKRHLPRRVLDIGTGSGVLAIAAARATHRPVVAGDIDATSVAAARQNARRNRAGALVAIVRADGVADRRLRITAAHDLVFANILVAPLKRLARPIGLLTAPGARTVLSGLLPSEANAALAAYRAAGFILDRRILLDGWATLVMTRPARTRQIVRRHPRP